MSLDVMPWDTTTGKVMTSPGCSGWARAEAPLSADISAAINVLLLVSMVLMLLVSMVLVLLVSMVLVLLVSMVLMLPCVMSFQCHLFICHPVVLSVNSNNQGHSVH